MYKLMQVLFTVNGGRSSQVETVILKRHPSFRPFCFTDRKRATGRNEEEGGGGRKGGARKTLEGKETTIRV